jgi:hypothetical protein
LRHGIDALITEHWDAKLTDLFARACGLPQGALGQHPRSAVQGGVRTETVVKGSRHEDRPGSQ